MDRSIPLPIHEFAPSGVTQMENEFIKEDKVKTLKLAMQRLVSKYGICMVLGALKDEAARMVLCNYGPEAVKIFDVLRATQEEVCEKDLS
jgi:hypothetical protein